jgi:RecB family exonuclease
MSGRARPDTFCDPDPRHLEARFVERLRATVSKELGGAPTIVVAPTARLRDQLQFVATRALGATAGVEFLLHSDLAESTLLAARRLPLRTLPLPWLRTLVATRLAAGDGRLADYVTGQPSALAPLLATFRDLRDGGFTPDELARARRRVGATAQQTLDLFRDYVTLLQELAPLRLGDGASTAIAALAVAPRPARALLHYGAYELVGAAQELIARSLAASGGTLFLPTTGSDRASAALLAATGAGAGAGAGTTTKAGDWPLPQRRRCQSAATPRDEVRFALRQLLAWHARDAIPFDEMALLARVPSACAAAVSAEAALLDLPLDHGHDTPLREQPAAARLALALRHLETPADRVVARAVRRSWPAEGPTLDEFVAGFARFDSLALRCATLRSLLPEEDAAAASLREAESLALRLADSPFAGALPRDGAGASALLRSLLDESAPPPKGAALRLLDLHQARALPLRRAVWIGANEKLFPRQGREDFFLPDADRAALSDATGRPLTRHADARADEELLAACAVAAVSEELVVTFARSDGEREQAPSPWLARIAGDAPPRALSRHPFHHLVGLHEATHLLAPNEALLLTLPPGGAAAGEAPPFVGPDAPALSRAFARARVIESYRADALDFDGDVGPVSPRLLSPSRLERLGRCPLQHFFADVLGLGDEEDEEPSTSGELPARERGSLFHRALEELYRTRFANSGGEPPAAPPPPGSAGHAEFLAALERDLAARLERLLQQDDFVGALSPALRPLRVACWSRELARFVARDWERLAEASIVGGSFEETAVADVGREGWPIRLRMRFDRILRDAAGAEIVGDYKSALRGGDKTSATAALRATQLQLPLYGLARLAAGKTLAGLELLSLHPRHGDDDGDGDGEPAWLSEFDVAKLLANRSELGATLETLDALRTDGAFPLVADSSDRGACGSCAFRLACRHAHGPTRARAMAAEGYRAWYALAAKKAPR